MQLDTETRNAELDGVFDLLRRQHDVKWDVVVPSSALRYDRGRLVVADGALTMDNRGVTLADAVLQPTSLFDGQIADRLGVPIPYLRRCRQEHVDLLDANVNGWLERADRRFLVRGFRVDDPAETGIARAFLSDKYRPMDNLDVLMAALEGVAEAGVQVDVPEADLSEQTMRVKIRCPQIATLAPTLLAGYRSPFTGESGDELPVVFAGLDLRNSETGGGAFQLTPLLTVQVCRNGMTLTKLAERKTHVGGRLADGLIRWSQDTQDKARELVRATTRDAVATFLSPAFLEEQVRLLEVQAGAPVAEPVKTIERVGKTLRWSQDEQERIVAMFVRGGQMTAGGVLNAVTAAAQEVESPDRSRDLEDQAVDAMALAARG